jgi:3-methyl-2-oxobutanoate hydroxymethyltransferase
MINAYDMLGYFDRVPKFAKRYANFRDDIVKAFQMFVHDVQTGAYPGEEHSYHMIVGEEEKLIRRLSDMGANA